jgi:hypothetical protein
LAWDTEREVYVFLRMSHLPNKDGGSTTAWINAWTPDRCYKFTDNTIPLTGSDVGSNSLTAGEGICQYEFNGKHHWRVRQDDVVMDLEMEDHHPGVSYWPESSAALRKQTAAHHIECTGYVKGSITLKGKEYIVDGAGWRDHSWGPRKWQAIRAHRGYLAFFGKELGIICLTWIGEDGTFLKTGTIIRENTVEFTDDFDIVAYIGVDGISNCGGHVVLALDGEQKRLDFEPIGKSVISMIDNFPLVDGMCKVVMGNKVGVGLAETTNHAQGGEETPYIFPESAGVIENGFFEPG